MDLTMRRERLRVVSQLDGVTQVQNWFSEICRSLDDENSWVSRYADRLMLALTEGFTNAVRHAHAELPPETDITIDFTVTNHRAEIRIWDYGEPFNPELLPEPEPGELVDSGYGWFLLRRLTDEVTYRRMKERNCLSIVQYDS